VIERLVIRWFISSLVTISLRKNMLGSFIKSNIVSRKSDSLMWLTRLGRLHSHRDEDEWLVVVASSLTELGDWLSDSLMRLTRLGAFIVIRLSGSLM